MFTYISVYLPIANIEKSVIEKSILKNMLKSDVSVTSVCWHQQGTFLERLRDVPPSAINIKNCNGFSILVKNENGDVTIDT